MIGRSLLSSLILPRRCARSIGISLVSSSTMSRFCSKNVYSRASVVTLDSCRTSGISIVENKIVPAAMAL